jgi:hypothetical protein
LSCLMMGKGARVAGTDRRKAPGPNPDHVERHLTLLLSVVVAP